MRSPVLLLVLLLASILSAGAAERPPNILLAIADDWSRHASIYGDPTVRTPVFDRLAREGALFRRAHCASPSCSPSRASLLTGRAVHQLEQGANLWSTVPAKFACYPDLLAAAGYQTACEGKGWGPGNVAAGGRTSPPAGRHVKSFEGFFADRDPAKPFCFWFGGIDPHRPYQPAFGAKSGLSADKITVPPDWPDTPEVRQDILNYYAEVERFDGRLGEIVAQLEAAGELDNTLIVITSDNGMPFPRGKANLYERGTAVPLAVRWPARIKPSQTFDAFVVLTDLAPTFVEAAGLPVPADMTGRSLLPMLTGSAPPQDRDHVFLERERHAQVRRGNLSYPSRAVRTSEYLYIRNLRPDRWPAGDPEMFFSVGEYGDIDNGPTKSAVVAMAETQKALADLALGKRPAEELYALRNDPHELTNLADHPEHAAAKKELRTRLDEWMTRTGDPRATSDDDRWDEYPYHGKSGR